jgi:hypothetical protein
MANRNNRPTAWAVRALLALSLVLIGFAHQPLAIAGMPGIAALPDGSIPSLCTTDSDGKVKQAATPSGCPACRLAQSLALPTPAVLGPVVLSGGEVLLPPGMAMESSPRTWPAARPRAPPVSPLRS